MGWVRTFRNNQFIALNDGSCNNNFQVVVALGMLDDATLKRITTGACIKATGQIIASLGKGQKVELKATAIEILGDSDAEKFMTSANSTVEKLPLVILKDGKFLNDPSLVQPTETEDMMLDITPEPRQPNSRLSCQIVASAELDGLVLHILESV